MVIPIPPSQYFTVFMIFLGTLIFFKCIPIGRSNILSIEYNNISLIKCIIVGAILILFIGLRDPLDPYNYFKDSSGYAAYFEFVKNGELPSVMDKISNGDFDDLKEGGFFFIRDTLAIAQFDVSFWFIVVASITIIPVIIAVHKLFPGKEYLAFLFWLSGYGFFGGAVNGLRNSNATSLFFLGLALLIYSLYSKDKASKLWGILLCLLSYGFHHSISILWIAAFLSYFIVKKTNTALIIWIAAIIVALVFGNLLADYALTLELDDRAERYLATGSDMSVMQNTFSRVGFRWDFLLFSALPIALGYYVTNILNIKDKGYQLLLNTYIIANAVWICFMYAAFTNRFAALSWSLYPFVICFPLIRYRIFANNQVSITAFFLIGLYCFNLLF